MLCLWTYAESFTVLVKNAKYFIAAAIFVIMIIVAAFFLKKDEETSGVQYSADGVEMFEVDAYPAVMSLIEQYYACYAAGDFEKLKTALHFGADAVYFAGKNYGLRAFGTNFESMTIKDTMDYIHSHGKKGYVTLNVYARHNDFDGLKDYVQTLVDAKNNLDASKNQNSGQWYAKILSGVHLKRCGEIYSKQAVKTTDPDFNS